MKARLLAFLFPELPPQRLALLRIFVGLFALSYLVARTQNLLSVLEFPAARFQPVGAAVLLLQPLSPSVLQGVLALSLAFGLAFTLGLRFAVSGPAFALLFLGVTTYRNSWGMVFHTENLVALHVALLAASPASAALSIDAQRARARGRGTSAAADGRFGWAVRSMSLVTVVAYVVAGVAKLKLSGGTWLGGELLRAQIAYDNLRKLELGTEVSPLGPWLVRKPGIFPALAVLTLLVELGAPLALFRRRIAALWVAAAWSFHLGVLLLMSIAFVYQLSGVAYLSFFPIERLLERFQTWGAARAQNSSVSPSGSATSAPSGGVSRSSKPAAHS